MVPFSMLFLLDSATFAFCLYGYCVLWLCQPGGFLLLLVGLVLGLRWFPLGSLHSVALFLSIHLRLYLLVGFWNQSSFVFALLVLHIMWCSAHPSFALLALQSYLLLHGFLDRTVLNVDFTLHWSLFADLILDLLFSKRVC